MTDMTGPTREDVEAFRPEAIIPTSDTVTLPTSQFNRWCENYQASLRAMEARHFAENAALRERLEAAEARVRSLQSYADEVCAIGNRALARAERAEAALTESRAREAAAWEAGRDAAAEKCLWLTGGNFGREVEDYIVTHSHIVALTPPADATAALTAVKDAEWNAALEAMRKGLMIENGSRGDHTIRALRRNPKEDTSHD